MLGTADGVLPTAPSQEVVTQQGATKHWNVLRVSAEATVVEAQEQMVCHALRLIIKTTIKLSNLLIIGVDLA